MGFPLQLAVRYMGSKKRSSISLGTFFAVLGVALGVAGLATAMSVTGGFRKEFRDKVLGVNAHVLVLKRSSYFGEYREMMADLRKVPGVVGIAPFTIHPMMVTRGDRTATGVLLKGVDPERMKDVLDLPKDIVQGGLEGLRVPGAAPPVSRRDAVGRSTFPSSKKDTTQVAVPDPKTDLFDQIETLLKDAADEAPPPPSSSAQRAPAESASDAEIPLPADAPVGSIV